MTKNPSFQGLRARTPLGAYSAPRPPAAPLTHFARLLVVAFLFHNVKLFSVSAPVARYTWLMTILVFDAMSISVFIRIISHDEYWLRILYFIRTITHTFYNNTVKSFNNRQPFKERGTIWGWVLGVGG